MTSTAARHWVARTARAWPARHPLLALWFLAMSVRIPVALATVQPGVDEALLFSYGTSWLRTGQYDGIHWPVPYPLAVGSLGMLVGARLAVELIYVVIGSLAVIPLFLGMQRLRGPATAAWGAAFVALLPAFGVVVNKSGSHSLFFPLMGLAFYLHVRALEDPRAKRLLALGAALGAAYVTRTDGLVLLATVILSMALVASPVAERARRMGLTLAGALLLVLPNVAHVHHHTGRWALSAMVETVVQKPFYLRGLADPALAEATREFQSAPGNPYVKLLTHPGYTARKIGYNLRLFLRALGDIYVFPAPFFALLGLAALSFLKDWARGGLLLLTWASPTLAYIALNVEPRYFSPMAIMLMLFAGEGWTRLREACGDRSHWFSAAVAAAVAFLLVINAMIGVASRKDDEPRIGEKAVIVLREAGDALGETFIFNPHVRFAIDGSRGGPRSAPLAQRSRAKLYVVDPDDPQGNEAQMERVRAAGGSFRTWQAGGLEFHERLP